MNIISFFFITAVLLFSCSSEKPPATGAKGPSDAGSAMGTSQQHGPAGGSSYALEIIPKDATREITFTLVPRGLDLSRTRIEWTVNDRPFTTAEPAKFVGTDAAKGDRIQARAIVQDQVVMSNAVEIKNAPPEVTSVKLLPEIFKPGDILNVEVEGIDIDGDGVTFLYEWTKNGESAGSGKNIEAAIKRGDKLAVKITPFDGEHYGTPVVLTREISNMPPVIVQHNDFSFNGKIYAYQVKASDPDGDPLIFSLESPPSGMTIDSSTGLLKWVVPLDFKGIQDVSVSVQDGKGGTARYNLKLTIK